MIKRDAKTWLYMAEWAEAKANIKRDAKTWLYMAEWAEAKANAASASSEPWAMANLRLYQNKASEFWSEYYKAKHAEELEMSIAFQEAGME